MSNFVEATILAVPFTDEGASILLFPMVLTDVPFQFKRSQLQFDCRLQSSANKLRTNLWNSALWIQRRINSYTDNCMFCVLEPANQTVFISTQNMQQQKILYTHRHCEIKHAGNVSFLISFFPFNQTVPQQRVAGYSQQINTANAQLFLTKISIYTSVKIVIKFQTK